MAAWQFHLTVVPRACAADEDVAGLVALMLDGSDHCWSEAISEQLMMQLSALDKIANRGRLDWDPSSVLWGDLDGTCVELASSGSIILELQCRLDMRVESAPLFEALVEVARNEGLVFIAQPGRVVEPDVQQLVAVAAHSPAAKFVANPAAFLRSLVGSN